MGCKLGKRRRNMPKIIEVGIEKKRGMMRHRWIAKPNKSRACFRIEIRIFLRRLSRKWIMIPTKRDLDWFRRTWRIASIGRFRKIDLSQLSWHVIARLWSLIRNAGSDRITCRRSDLFLCVCTAHNLPPWSRDWIFFSRRDNFAGNKIQRELLFDLFFPFLLISLLTFTNEISLCVTKGSDLTYRIARTVLMVWLF